MDMAQLDEIEKEKKRKEKERKEMSDFTRGNERVNENRERTRENTEKVHSKPGPKPEPKLATVHSSNTPTKTRQHANNTQRSPHVSSGEIILPILNGFFFPTPAPRSPPALPGGLLLIGASWMRVSPAPPPPAPAPAYAPYSCWCCGCTPYEPGGGGYPLGPAAFHPPPSAPAAAGGGGGGYALYPPLAWCGGVLSWYRAGAPPAEAGAGGCWAPYPAYCWWCCGCGGTAPYPPRAYADALGADALGGGACCWGCAYSLAYGCACAGEGGDAGACACT